MRDELLAIVGSNAAGFNLGVFAIDDDGCAFQFDNDGDDPYIIPVHMAAATMSGMGCDGGMGTHFITRMEASTADGTNWDTTDTWIQRADMNSLRDGMEITDTLVTGDPELDAYGQAQCGTMFIGPGGLYYRAASAAVAQAVARACCVRPELRRPARGRCPSPELIHLEQLAIHAARACAAGRRWRSAAAPEPDGGWWPARRSCGPRCRTGASPCPPIPVYLHHCWLNLPSRPRISCWSARS